ncbi:hypothetical protein Tdes44962_MAKER03200 [Teratosphaeria destructans]|uniref:Uncharacterized protein n=1 Tax=Teratosphaeria destructans TaxID=418781 RepID=A0A9W7SQN5_9PEZI|nr:hypothetical protein Tdes44962_MAKER03200 [Teratosphaeria destructans]
MHGLKSLPLLALVGFSAARFEVTFQRFSDKSCSATHKIEKDTHLKSGNCKTFDHHEPGFESFRVHIEHMPDANKDCYAQVYDKPECQGDSWTDNDLLDQEHECIPNEPHTTLDTGVAVPQVTDGVTGRSVKIVCRAKEQINVVHGPAFSTITLQAQPTPYHHCCCDEC